MILNGPLHRDTNNNMFRSERLIKTECCSESPQTQKQNILQRLQSAQFIEFQLQSPKQNYSTFISQQIVNNYSVYEPKYRKYEREDWKKLNKISDKSLVSYTELECNLRNGIPDDLRPKLWFWLTGVQKMERKYRGQYEILMNKPSCYDDQINKDIARTLNTHSYFNGQRDKATSNFTSKYNSPQLSNVQSTDGSRQGSVSSTESSGSIGYTSKTVGQQQLFNILRAYANLDKEVGYVHGMSYLAAHILLNLRPEKYTNFAKSFGTKCSESSIEEKAFLIFVHIMIDKNWRQTYIPGLIRHRILIENAKKQFHPELLDHFQDINMDVILSFSPFYLSLFLDEVSVEFGRRFLDLFLLKGELLIEQMILRLLDMYHEQILRYDDGYSCSIFIMQEMLKNAYRIHKNELSILLPLSNQYTKKI